MRSECVPRRRREGSTREEHRHRHNMGDEESVANFEPGQGTSDSSHLATQRVEDIEAGLNPLSPQVISRQATINIGTIGHVAHGKSTVVKSISGVQVCACFRRSSWGCARNTGAGGERDDVGD